MFTSVVGLGESRMIWRLLSHQADGMMRAWQSWRHPKEDENVIERMVKGNGMESRALKRVLQALVGIRNQSELHFAIGGG